MFMAMPDPRFPHHYASLGGVRVITRPPSRKQRTRGTRRLLRVLQDMVADGTDAEAVERGRSSAVAFAPTAR